MSVSNANTRIILHSHANQIANDNLKKERFIFLFPEHLVISRFSHETPTIKHVLPLKSLKIYEKSMINGNNQADFSQEKAVAFDLFSTQPDHAFQFLKSKNVVNSVDEFIHFLHMNVLSSDIIRILLRDDCKKWLQLYMEKFETDYMTLDEYSSFMINYFDLKDLEIFSAFMARSPFSISRSLMEQTFGNYARNQNMEVNDKKFIRCQFDQNVVTFMIPDADPNLRIHIHSQGVITIPRIATFENGNMTRIEIVPFSKSPSLIVFSMINGSEYVPLKPLEIVPQIPRLGVLVQRNKLWKKYLFEFDNDQEAEMWQQEIKTLIEQCQATSE